jgi:hypothetical protein
MIKHFNNVSAWVTTCIVTRNRRAQRIEVLKKYEIDHEFLDVKNVAQSFFSRFIRVMEALKELNNFNGMMEILSGINKSLSLSLSLIITSILILQFLFILFSFLICLDQLLCTTNERDLCRIRR